MDGFAAGDLVFNTNGWAEYGLMGEGVERPSYMIPRKLDPAQGRISQAVGVLGMLGLTAYAGMVLHVRAQARRDRGGVGRLRRGRPDRRPAGAAARRCAWSASPGSEEKCRFVVDELGFDACVSHLSPDLRRRPARGLPGRRRRLLRERRRRGVRRGAAAVQPRRPDDHLRPDRPLRRRGRNRRPRRADGARRGRSSRTRGVHGAATSSSATTSRTTTTSCWPKSAPQRRRREAQVPRGHPPGPGEHPHLLRRDAARRQLRQDARAGRPRTRRSEPADPRHAGPPDSTAKDTKIAKVRQEGRGGAACDPWCPWRSWRSVPRRARRRALGAADFVRARSKRPTVRAWRESPVSFGARPAQARA